MKVVTYEGIVENGCVHVASDISLPENAKVYVVIPETNESAGRRVIRISSPRLAHPEQAKDFIKEVFEADGAEI